MPTNLEPVQVDQKWTWVVPSPGKVEITTVGIPGPPGASADKNFLFNQVSASAVWVITHNLAKYPSVTVFDSTGRVVVGDVVHNSTSQLTITFSAAFAGKATLN